MSPKLWCLPGFILIFTSIGCISGQEGLYSLISAHDAAQAKLYSFQVRINYYGQYITNQTETLSRLLTDLVIDRLETMTTAEEGFRMQGCILLVATEVLFTMFDVGDDYDDVQRKMIEFHQSVLKELMDINILTDFEAFHNTHQEHLADLADKLNSDLLDSLVESLRDLVSAQDYLGPRLVQCLSEVEK